MISIFDTINLCNLFCFPIFKYMIKLKLVNKMIIEKITFLKKEYEIFFSNNNSVKIIEDTLIKLNLYKGMEVSEDFPEILSYQNTQILAFNLSSRYLRLPKSSQQVKDFLYKKNFHSNIIEDTITSLMEKGYLNDLEYGLRYLKDAQHIKKYGRKKIFYMLLRKGISQEDIQKIFEHYDDSLEYSNCKELSLQKYKDLHNQKNREHMIRFLIGRGYSYDLITLVLQEIQ